MLFAMGCARVDDAAPADSAVGAETLSETGVAGSSDCANATSGTYPCGADVRACDPSRPSGLPSGACSAGATCDVIVRAASCSCDVDDGPRFPWSCTCVSGAWQCTAAPPDGRTCGCAANPPFPASCEAPAPATGSAERRWVGLAPETGTTGASLEPMVSLQGSSPPSAELKAAIVNAIRLYSFTQKAWVRATIEPAHTGETFLRWTVRPRDTSFRGKWALRVGPLPAVPGLAYASGPFVFCEGYAETHFTVLGE